MWKKSGMAVAFKETGLWTCFSFVGTPGGVTTDCYWKSVAFSASGLFLAHLTVDGVAIAEGSQLVATLHLDGSVLAKNYQHSRTSGGFYTSAAGSQTVSAGSHSVQFCIGGVSLSTWEPSYSLSGQIGRAHV